MTTFINTENNYTFRYFDALGKNRELNTTVIRTKEDYVEWVKAWKVHHEQIVATIKAYRVLKNKSKLAKDGNASAFWLYKKQAGSVANALYKMRAENKEKFKVGEFSMELETA